MSRDEWAMQMNCSILLTRESIPTENSPQQWQFVPLPFVGY